MSGRRLADDGKRNEVQRNVVDRCIDVFSRREVRNRGGVWGGEGSRSSLMGGWRMTGSAEKCFSMNVVERCVEKG